MLKEGTVRELNEMRNIPADYILNLHFYAN